VQFVQKEALKWQKEIQQKSDSNLKICLYKHNGVFLITNGEMLIYDEEFYEFLPEYERFEYVEDVMDVYDFVGKKHIDKYISNALISVGAEKILPHIALHLKTLRDKQKKFEYNNEIQRAEDIESPKVIIEVYNIEKDYKPVKIKDVKIAHMSSLFTLPELRELTSGDRVAYKALEIGTDKVIENNINDVIESIKYNKWQRKHPATIDMNDMQRMELDSDDPDFLSYDDYLGNGDENEEDDEDY
jgi:hypothetical protein